MLLFCCFTDQATCESVSGATTITGRLVHCGRLRAAIRRHPGAFPTVSRHSAGRRWLPLLLCLHVAIRCHQRMFLRVHRHAACPHLSMGLPHLREPFSVTKACCSLQSVCIVTSCCGHSQLNRRAVSANLAFYRLVVLRHSETHHVALCTSVLTDGHIQCIQKHSSKRSIT